MRTEVEAPKFILVVEDDSLIRSNIIEILHEEGYQALGVGNGEEALSYLQKAPILPGLILLDLMMPVMDGWRFRTEQKLNDRFCRIPVVVVTADGNAQQKAKNIDAEGWVRKPIEINNLLKVIQQCCG